MDEAIAALAANEAEQEARRAHICELEAAETRRLRELAGLKAHVTARLEEARAQVMTYIVLLLDICSVADATLQPCTSKWLRHKACACARQPEWLDTQCCHTPHAAGAAESPCSLRH